MLFSGWWCSLPLDIPLSEFVFEFVDAVSHVHADGGFDFVGAVPADSGPGFRGGGVV